MENSGLLRKQPNVLGIQFSGPAGLEKKRLRPIFPVRPPLTTHDSRADLSHSHTLRGSSHLVFLSSPSSSPLLNQGAHELVWTGDPSICWTWIDFFFPR